MTIVNPTLRHFHDIDPEAEIRSHTEVVFQSGRKLVLKEPHIMLPPDPADPTDSGEVVILTLTKAYNIPVELNIEYIVTDLPKDGTP